MSKQYNFNGYLIKKFGAYIRTDLREVVNVTGVGSGVIGVVGMAEKGIANEPVVISNYRELVETFGDGPLVRHGLAMFVGGASQLVAVRIGDPEPAQLTNVVVGSTPTALSYTWEAVGKGTFGNNISVAVYNIDAEQDNSVGSDLARFNDDTYRVEIRYYDGKGNDFGETYIFPRYIPNPVVDGVHQFYTANTENWYVLRDRDTGYIRTVPETWGYGAATEADFLANVDKFKAPSDDLLSFPAFYTDSSVQKRTPFPLALIAETINNGSFNYPASEFVRLTNVDDDIATITAPDYDFVPLTQDTLIEHLPFNLSGGTNGEDGTGFYGTGDVNFNSAARETWVEGLGVLEEEDVDFVQPAYLFNTKGNGNLFSNRFKFFKSVMPLFVAHINTQSNTPNRKFRLMVAGLPYYGGKDAKAFLNEIQEVSGVINCDRIQLWAGGFKSSAFSNKVELYGADMLASFVAGLNSARTVNKSITFEPIAGIFTDGLEFYWKSSEKDTLISRHLAFVARRKNAAGATDFIPQHNYTSWTGSVQRGVWQMVTARIRDYVHKFLFTNLEETFIGQESLGASTEGAVADYTRLLLDRLVADKVIVAYTDVSVKRYVAGGEPDAYEIKFRYQPPSEIDFLFATASITYKLA